MANLVALAVVAQLLRLALFLQETTTLQLFFAILVDVELHAALPVAFALLAILPAAVQLWGIAFLPQHHVAAAAVAQTSTPFADVQQSFVQERPLAGVSPLLGPQDLDTVASSMA